MSNEVKFDENVPCEICGRFGAYLFDGEHLCADCYETRGSCCQECEQEKDVLSQRDEEKKSTE